MNASFNLGIRVYGSIDYPRVLGMTHTHTRVCFEEQRERGRARGLIQGSLEGCLMMAKKKEADRVGVKKNAIIKKERPLSFVLVAK